MRRSPSLCIFPRGSRRITPHCRLDMRSFNPVPPNKKTFSIVICTGDNADLPEGRGCLRTFFEKIYESMMRVDLLAVVFHAVSLRPCGSIRDVPLAICSPDDELWPYGSRHDCQSHMLTRNEHDSNPIHETP